MVKSHHKLILSSGRFSGTSRAQLSDAFDAFVGDAQKNTLVIHFHGGLVSQGNAEEMAERLLPIYRSAGSYPLFVMWQTGLDETLRNNWQEIVRENAFSALVDRVLQFVVGKLDQAPGQKGGDVELPSRFEVQDEVVTKRSTGQEPFADREPEAAALHPELTPAEQAQFEELLKNDPALESAAADLSRADAPELDPAIEAELERARTGELGDKGLVSTATLVAAGVRILARVLRRFANQSDHGIYTTVVEEVVRELKGDLVGGIVWHHMKKDSADSFEGSEDTHGGTALLAEIARVWQAGQRPRIVLVGHSAGSVYICHLLEQAAQTLPPDIRFEVIFLAPACTFQLLDRALTRARDRVKSFRCFAMGDVFEKQDAIFAPIYTRSLLYFVSGLAEDAVDLPLVGMQRYHSGAAPFDDARFPDIKRVRDSLGSFADAWVWAEANTADGLRTISRTHGGFDNEELTLKSVAYLITNEAL